MRLTLAITTPAGTTEYKLCPRPTPPGIAAAVRLIKMDDFTGENVAIYDVALSDAGKVSCTCKGFTEYRRCKHAEALVASKCLLAEERRLLQQQQAYFEARVAELDQKLAVANREAAQARAEMVALLDQLAAAHAPRSARPRSRKAVA